MNLPIVSVVTLLRSALAIANLVKILGGGGGGGGLEWCCQSWNIKFGSGRGGGGGGQIAPLANSL